MTVLCFVFAILAALQIIFAEACELGATQTRTCSPWQHYSGKQDVFHMKVRRRSSFKCRNSGSVTEACNAATGWRIKDYHVQVLSSNKGGHTIAHQSSEGQLFYNAWQSAKSGSNAILSSITNAGIRDCIRQKLQSLAFSGIDTAMAGISATGSRAIKATLKAHTSGSAFDCSGGWETIRITINEVCTGESTAAMKPYVDSKVLSLIPQCLPS